MPRPALRSRSFRKMKKHLPGGVSIIHYLKRRPSNAKCSNCGSQLHGVARERPSILKKMSKSKKKPSRPYGGNLCTKCTREEMKNKARR